MSETAIGVLARFGANFRLEDAPLEVIHHAQRALIDWHASLYPGLGMPAVKVLEATLSDELDRGAARLATGRAATVRAAALINATAAHAAELDDSYREAMYHPGAATIAAAMATAQTVGASASEFLKAVVLGYEISTRIGMVMGREHYKYWHNTGTMGAFGAAAACASLYRLDKEEYAHSLAIAATLTSGLQQAFRLEPMVKPLHAGRAAEAGVMSAQMAHQGMRSSLDILEGEVGIGQAMSNGPDWTDIGATLGSVFHITRLTFKNHVGCGHAFAAIDGALSLQEEHGFGADDISTVQLGVYRSTLDIAPHVDPRTPDEAKFSLHYMVATALTHGSVRVTAFEPARLNDPKTRSLMQRIEASLDPEVEAAFPQRRSARVCIKLKDGTCLHRLQPDRKGDPELPLSDKDLEGKLLELTVPVIGMSQAKNLLNRIWALNSQEAMI